MKKALSAFVALGVVASLPAGFAAAATPTVDLHVMHPTAKIKANGISPMAMGAVSPAQMRGAYGLDQLPNQGAGQTVAIVDAYGSPTMAADLNTFDAQYGLPAANLTIANPQGTPTVDGGWALETSMDVEWVHSLAPQAHILLVQTKSASTTDLLGGIDYAASQGAVAISNSWGGSETRTESTYDSHFNLSNAVVLASSGDSGKGAQWPVASPYVLAVGGTTLSLSGNTWAGETAWNGSGGGPSRYESALSYQTTSPWASTIGSKRGIPDVAMDADPNSGAAVYDSTPDSGQSGWFQVGGTSLSSPMMAAVIALADENRSSKLGGLQVHTALYSLAKSAYSTNFHDVTSGSNGYAAAAGWDFVTGLGSPVGNQLVPALSAY